MKKVQTQVCFEKCGGQRLPFPIEKAAMNGPLRRNAKCWVSNVGCA